MKVPFKVDLSDKIVAITGAGGVICSEFARALAECGAKVALLDVNFDAAKKSRTRLAKTRLPSGATALTRTKSEKPKKKLSKSSDKSTSLSTAQAEIIPKRPPTTKL